MLDASCRNSFIQQNQGIHGSQVETWHAASLLVAYKLISVNLFNLRHLCSGFKIPDSKIVLDHLGRGYSNPQNQGIHGSQVETLHATSLQVACRVSTG